MSLEVVVVTHHAPTPAHALDRMVGLLVEALTRCYRDRVWRVRLVPGIAGAGAPPIEASVSPASPAIASADLIAFIDDFFAQWGAAFDRLVIDASALFGGALTDAEVNEALSQAVLGLTSPAIAAISYLVDSPQQWIDAQLIPPPNPLRRPVALLGDAPPAGPGAAWLGLFDDLAKATWPSPQGLADAIGDLVAGLVKFHADGGGSATGSPEVWPIDAARLRITAALRGELAIGAERLADLSLGVREHARRTFERWARAVSGRRVGLALGGGSALSYVCIAFLRRMIEAGIPVDVVSGTSFGSVVACYFASRGDDGLAALTRHWYWTQWTVLLGWLSTNPFQLWIDFDLGFADINDFEVTFVPVAAAATTGHEWYVRSGAAGHACAASGSLPPLSPTYDGDRRLLDGALTAGVPAMIAAAAGADVVVGVNSVPYPSPLPADPALPLPRLWNLVRALNPLRRLVDFSRGYEMLFRQSGHSQETFADVVYPADTQGISGAAFYAWEAIIADALASQPLKDAFDQLQQRWDDMIADPGWIRFWRDGDRVVVGGDLERCRPLDPIDVVVVSATGVLSPEASVIVAGVVALMLDHAWIRIVIRVDSPGPLADGEARRDGLLGAFPAALLPRVGTHLRHGAVPAPRVEFELWRDVAALPHVVELAP